MGFYSSVISRNFWVFFEHFSNPEIWESVQSNLSSPSNGALIMHAMWLHPIVVVVSTGDVFKLEIQAFQAKLELKIMLFLQAPNVPFEAEKPEFELETA